MSRESCSVVNDAFFFFALEKINTGNQLDLNINESNVIYQAPKLF